MADVCVQSAETPRGASGIAQRLGRMGRELYAECLVLCRLLRHREAPWSVRLIAGAAVLYLVSPVQIIPSFIPIIGQSDDLFVLWAARKLVRRLASPSLLRECGDGRLIH